ncbi:hypothetical protein Pdw03_1113 [Penicillium digitatum]|uniref:Uncharacterized protein n=1 Tax=Penicillium digitatum TaxID=36651 RepID=A0A7T6XRR8_PENDI|nr:hypothetical protein Pdw03_1113 [Penicillium digitatum]
MLVHLVKPDTIHGGCTRPLLLDDPRNSSSFHRYQTLDVHTSKKKLIAKLRKPWGHDLKTATNEHDMNSTSRSRSGIIDQEHSQAKTEGTSWCTSRGSPS